MPQWFSLFFQLVLLLLVTACAFSSRWFLALRTPLLPFFSVAILLSIQVGTCENTRTHSLSLFA